jgi:hypothetical protein
MKEQVTIWIDKELLNEIRKYAEETTNSKKALSGTISNILREKIKHPNKPQSEADPKKPAHTHTESDDSDIPDKRIMKTLEWIEKNNPTGITKKGIEEAIKETKGMDNRTVRKYMPIVQDRLRSIGYAEHPANHLLLIRE